MNPISLFSDLKITNEYGDIQISDTEGKTVNLTFSDKKTFKQFLNSTGISMFSLGKVNKINQMMDDVGLGYKIIVNDKLIAEKETGASPNIKYLRLLPLMF